MNGKQANTAYRPTLGACVLSVGTSAIAANLLPILFVPVMDRYGLPFSALGTLVVVFYLSELAVSLLFGRLPDRFGFRPLLMISSLATALAFLLLFASPKFFGGHMLAGLSASAVACGATAGFLEMMVNPVVTSLPFENKPRVLTLFHSSFAVCTVIAVAVTSIAVHFLPGEAWSFSALIWVPVPVAAFIFWCKVPIVQPAHDQAAAGSRVLFKSGRFYLSVFAMIAGVACETIISSGASAFIEKGLSVSKLTGDLLGPCMFSLAFGLGRFLYGMFGEKLNVHTLMVWGSFACLLLYLCAALVPVTVVSIAALALCGFAVSLLLPCTFATTSMRFPTAGVWLSAVLSGAGKSGAAGGPALFGFLGETFILPGLAPFAERVGITLPQLSLRIALLCCAVFPLASWALQIVIRRKERAYGLFRIAEPAAAFSATAEAACAADTAADGSAETDGKENPLPSSDGRTDGASPPSDTSG